ncbi:hypothetical protein [Streptomyces chattanoogensis]|uniref:hypothetical protein n=1 Tax=Streptomyces chattanoogensis TaxID=66876 RepID=UPI0036AF56A9
MVKRVPGWLLRHRITVEAYAGDTAYGPSYDLPVCDVPALVDEAPRMVRGEDGREVLTATTVIAAPDLNCPPGSRITLPDGRTTTALTVARHTSPGLPVPANTVVSCE